MCVCWEIVVKLWKCLIIRCFCVILSFGLLGIILSTFGKQLCKSQHKITKSLKTTSADKVKKTDISKMYDNIGIGIFQKILWKIPEGAESIIIENKQRDIVLIKF